MRAQTTLTQRILAQAARRGDAEALERLLRELEPLVVRTARLIVRSGSWAAEDAAQEALLDVANGIRTLNDPERVAQWAARVAANRALRVAKRERLRAAFTQELRVEPELLPALPEHVLDVKAAFDRLPPSARAVATLRLYCGLSEDETAHALGLSLGTVKSQLHEARRRLTETLARQGYGPSVRSSEAREAAS